MRAPSPFSHPHIGRWFAIACFVLALRPGPSSGETIAIQPPKDQGLVLTQEDRAARAKLAQMIDRSMREPDLLEKIQRIGDERTPFCKACHGEDGNAIKPGVPNLAGQNPVYLLDQFQRFGDGRRYDYAMTALASSLTEEERVYLALYFSRMRPRPTEGVSPEQKERGKAVYEAACVQCHGKTGRGEPGYARLASQKADYLVKMLKEFRNYRGHRKNPYMSAVAVSLTEREIQDVAAYLASMD